MTQTQFHTTICQGIELKAINNNNIISPINIKKTQFHREINIRTIQHMTSQQQVYNISHYITCVICMQFAYQC